MASGGMMVRMGLAALASAAAAGLLATLTVFFGGLLFGSPGSWWSLPMLANWLPIGFLAGLAIASLPAFFAGASMWALGDSYGAARHPLAWAAAGAAVGGGLRVVFGILLGPDEIGAEGWALFAASLGAGAGGALVFLGAMRLGGRP